MSDLLALATSVVEKAQAGEGMEVYVVRGSETEVRAYEGSLESLTSADSSGVGIRVVLEGALRESKWNKTRAAEKLGVSPKTLLAKLRAIGLEE